MIHVGYTKKSNMLWSIAKSIVSILVLIKI